MNTVLFLILRRMRPPLLLLTIVYAVATFGLTLLPGLDDEGNVWHMDFFHAFYFVTFMGTTIETFPSAVISSHPLRHELHQPIPFH